MQRGKILRDTNTGPGILHVNGQQKEFTLERHWKSDVPPKVGAVVDVVLNDAGEIESVTAVPEADLAREQAGKLASSAMQKSLQLKEQAIARIGAPTLIAMAVLAAAWYFLSTINLRASASHSIGLSFYEVLKMANMGDALIMGVAMVKYADAGIYGVLMWAVLLAPLLPHFLSNRNLNLAYTAPLLYLGTMVAIFFYKVSSTAGETARTMGSFFGGAERAAKLAEQAKAKAMEGLGLGLGFYVAIATAAFLAYLGIQRFLASSAAESE